MSCTPVPTATQLTTVTTDLLSTTTADPITIPGALTSITLYGCLPTPDNPVVGECTLPSPITTETSSGTPIFSFQMPMLTTIPQTVTQTTTLFSACVDAVTSGNSAGAQTATASPPGRVSTRLTTSSIVGCVIGGLALMLILVVLLTWWLRRRHSCCNDISDSDIADASAINSRSGLRGRLDLLSPADNMENTPNSHEPSRRGVGTDAGLGNFHNNTHVAPRGQANANPPAASREVMQERPRSKQGTIIGAVTNTPSSSSLASLRRKDEWPTIVVTPDPEDPNNTGSMPCRGSEGPHVTGTVGIARTNVTAKSFHQLPPGAAAPVPSSRTNSQRLGYSVDDQ